VGCIEFGTRLNQCSIEIGHLVYIGTNCCIGACRMEDDVLIGSKVDIISGSQGHFFYDLDTPIREQGGKLGPIVIGEDAWLADSSVIVANIGRKSIIGSGSTVVKDMEWIRFQVRCARAAHRPPLGGQGRHYPARLELRGR